MCLWNQSVFALHYSCSNIEYEVKLDCYFLHVQLHWEGFAQLIFHACLFPLQNGDPQSLMVDSHLISLSTDFIHLWWQCDRLWLWQPMFRLLWLYRCSHGGTLEAMRCLRWLVKVKDKGLFRHCSREHFLNGLIKYTGCLCLVLTQQNHDHGNGSSVFRKKNHARADSILSLHLYFWVHATVMS